MQKKSNAYITHEQNKKDIHTRGKQMLVEGLFKADLL